MRQRRRQQVLLISLVVLALIVCLLPAPQSTPDTATASALAHASNKAKDLG
jgi:hypothetical protein